MSCLRRCPHFRVVIAYTGLYTTVCCLFLQHYVLFLQHYVLLQYASKKLSFWEMATIQFAIFGSRGVLFRSVPFYSISFCFALHARFAARLWREMPSFIVELPGASGTRAVVKGGVVRTVL